MKFVTKPSSEIETVDFNRVLQTSSDTVRYSNDKSKFLLKYEGLTPSFCSGLTEYSLEEIRIILASPEWTPANFS